MTASVDEPVGVIVIHFGSPEVTEQCVRSILPQLRPFDRVAVVDNSGNFRADARWLPKPIVVRPAENLGYGAAANCGAKEIGFADLAYIWVLNNDLEVLEGSLDAIREAAHSDPEVGLWGSTLLEPGGKTVQVAGGFTYRPALNRSASFLAGAPYEAALVAAEPQFSGMAGAAMFFRSDAFNLIGGFDEGYFLYYEELDVAQRLKATGWRLGWCRTSVLVHAAAHSTGGRGTSGSRSSSVAEYHSTYSALRYTSIYHRSLLPAVTLIRVMQRTAGLICSGQLSLVRSVGRATLAFYSGETRRGHSLRTATVDSVLMLTSEYVDSRRGGLEGHIYYLSKALRELGVNVEVLRVGPSPAIYPVPADVPFRWHRTDPGLGPRLRSFCEHLPGLANELLLRLAQNRRVKRLAAQLQVSKGSIVHQHDFLASWRLMSALSAEHPTVWTNHLGEFLYLSRSRVGRLALVHLTRRYQRIIAPSQELAEVPGRAGIVRTIPNGVDVSRFQTVPADERLAERQSLGWDEQNIVLIPRRWAPTKGVIFAAQAAKELKNEGRLGFVFVGGGESEYPDYAQAVEAELAASPHSTVIHEAGLDEMPRFYRAADFTLIPSLMEATSLAALEAMASGSIVIATAVGGLLELIEDGRTGMLVEPGSTDELVAVIMRALSMPVTERETIQQHARDFVVSNYSWSAIAARTYETYRELGLQ